MVDLSPFVIFDFTGPGALAYLQHMATNNVEVKVGRSVYTPLLTEGGGFKADLTMLRLGDEHFRVVTGAFDGPRDKHWFRSHLPEDGQVQMTDLTSAMVTIGVWGPKARDLVQSITDHDVSDTAFPYGHTQAIDFGSINARLFRISYVGELGWEIYVPTEQGQPMWDRLWEGGQDFGVLPVGAGVYGTTGRLEKGYRLMGAELESEFGPVEAGLSRPTVKPVDFIGREAYLKTRDIDSAAVLCTLTVEDHMSKRDGIKRFMTGREPITSPSGERLVDEKGRPSYVTSAGAGPSVGKYLLLAYLPPEYAVAGTDLAVMYMDELYPVKVAVAGSIPLFDPDDQRMKY